MSARQSGAVRVGCGHYGWHFGADADGRVKKLVIDIEVMCVLPVEESEPTRNGSRLCHILGAQTFKRSRVFQLLTPCDQSKVF